jgi:hypothetical protein
MESCENCGAAIGNLETPGLWKDHVVCASCYARLTAPESTSTDALKRADLEAIRNEASRVYEQSRAYESSRLRGGIPPKKNPDGSYKGMATAAFILSICGLFCFGFITGILAIIFGGVALSGMSRTGDRAGEEWAQAAIVIGGIDCLLWIIIVFVWVHDSFLIPR